MPLLNYVSDNNVYPLFSFRCLTSVLDDFAENTFAIDAAKSLLAGFAAATLLTAAPSADAGVVLQQPQVKNFVKGTAPAPSSTTSSSTKKEPRRNENAGDPDAFDVKILALPLSVASVVGAYFALSAVDPGFVEFMEEASTKDSRGFAGYETGLKDTPFFGGSGDVPRAAGGSAPKKAAPKKKFF